METPTMTWRRLKPFLALIAGLAAWMTAISAQAQNYKFKVLHTFHGNDGALPLSILIRDEKGYLYGTTSEGGKGVCSSYGCGTAFKLDKTGKQVWLYSFNGKNGRTPAAGLLLGASGKLYGTTTFGGKIEQVCGGSRVGGCGTVFSLDSAGKETVLYEFNGTPNGWFPEALLVEDSAGNLYGTTPNGGAYDNAGTVFRVDNKGNEVVLYNFCSLSGCADGNSPYPGVILDAADNLYGVTASGGAYGAGEVFELDASGHLTVLYSFTGSSDGGDPFSVLVADAAGNLYGTTTDGGNDQCGGSGCGVVFEVSPGSDGTWTEKVLYTFCSLFNCADGESPGSGPLVRDSTGNLYGTTRSGGTYDNGVIYRLDSAGNETILHDFTGGADGGFPQAGLTSDSSGDLYGTTNVGGYPCSVEKKYGCGVVFDLTP